MAFLGWAPFVIMLVKVRMHSNLNALLISFLVFE